MIQLQQDRSRKSIALILVVLFGKNITRATALCMFQHVQSSNAKIWTIQKSFSLYFVFEEECTYNVSPFLLSMSMITVVTGDNPEVQAFKIFLWREFDINDLGQLRYFLGIDVSQSQKGIVISKKKCLGFVRLVVLVCVWSIQQLSLIIVFGQDSDLLPDLGLHRA